MHWNELNWIEVDQIGPNGTNGPNWTELDENEQNWPKWTEVDQMDRKKSMKEVLYKWKYMNV